MIEMQFINKKLMEESKHLVNKLKQHKLKYCDMIRMNQQISRCNISRDGHPSFNSFNSIKMEFTGKRKGSEKALINKMADFSMSKKQNQAHFKTLKKFQLLAQNEKSENKTANEGWWKGNQTIKQEKRPEKINQPNIKNKRLNFHSSQDLTKRKKIFETPKMNQYDITRPKLSSKQILLLGQESKTTQNIKQNTKQVNSGKSSFFEKKQEEKVQKKVDSGFVEKLTYNEVFFCPHCFRYVFAIQKFNHYPECKNKVTEENDALKQKLAFQRLHLIQQLSFYTKTKVEIINETIKKIETKSYPVQELNETGQNYLKLEQIEESVHYIYLRLLLMNSSYEGNEILCGQAYGNYE